MPYHKLYTAKAPVNIALIKYWGKEDSILKLPINDSLSGTLDLNDMSATTSVAISETFEEDEFLLNGSKQDLSATSNFRTLIEAIRKLSTLEEIVRGYKVHIVSFNDFPTAAGLASSAAGYACLAFVLGQAYGVTDPVILSTVARQGSGSACRSLFGGFVSWSKGHNHESSHAAQIVDHNHWPEMRVVICVINESKKTVSSSQGMARSVKTSSLIRYRAEQIVPERIEAIKRAILKKDFNEFAEITMKDSNQFHAICLDTYPPISYLNDSSFQIISICSKINSFFGKNVLAYTFDAGPNACVYTLSAFADVFIALIKNRFPSTNESKQIDVKGKTPNEADQVLVAKLIEMLDNDGLRPKIDSISHIIYTSIGEGPKLIQEHINHHSLHP